MERARGTHTHTTASILRLQRAPRKTGDRISLACYMYVGTYLPRPNVESLAKKKEKKKNESGQHGVESPLHTVGGGNLTRGKISMLLFAMWCML